MDFIQNKNWFPKYNISIPTRQNLVLLGFKKPLNTRNLTFIILTLPKHVHMSICSCGKDLALFRKNIVSIILTVIYVGVRCQSLASFGFRRNSSVPWGAIFLSVCTLGSYYGTRMYLAHNFSVVTWRQPTSSSLCGHFHKLNLPDFIVFLLSNLQSKLFWWRVLYRLY